MPSHEKERELVGAYIRTSSDEQEASEVEQKAFIEEFCDRRGWKIGWLRNDEMSGYAEPEKRPGLTRLLEEQKQHGFTKIVVWKSERAFRNAEASMRIRRVLRERGCVIVGVQDPVEDKGTADTTLVLGMSALTAEHYRNALSDRQKASHKFKATNGLHQGGPPPFGYRSAPDLHKFGHARYAGMEPDSEVFGDKTIAEWLAWIFEEYRRAPNATKLCLKLNEAGVPSPAYLSRWHRLDEQERKYRLEKAQRRADTGRAVLDFPPSKTWDPATVSSVILRNKTYTGLIPYKAGQGKNNSAKQRREKEWHPGAHAPLVSEQLFHQVQAILDANSRSHRKPADRANDVLLGGMIVCGGCGKAVSRIAKNAWQTKYLCNRSRTSLGTVCDEPRYNTNSVDSAATSLLMRGIKLRRQHILEGGQHQPVKVQDALTAKLEKLEAQKAKLKYMFLNEHIDQIELDQDMAKLLPQIEDTKAKLAEETGPRSLDEVDRVIGNIETHWANWDLAQRQLVLRTYVPKGFKLAMGLLRAKVCGLELEVEVPILPPPTKGTKYGKPRTKGSRPDAKPMSGSERAQISSGGVMAIRNPAAPT